MRYIPLSDRILVRPIAEAKVTKNGIIIPDGAKEINPFRVGVVVEKGSLATELELDETVTYPVHVGLPIKVGDEDLIVMRQNDVILVHKK